jgi:hypothetical protein
VFRSEDGNWIWAFFLAPHDAGTSPIRRNRIATSGASRLTRALYTYLMEPGSLVMEGKMLLGIQEHPERLALDSREPS